MTSYRDCNAIAELDLKAIKVKLMHKESGEGWTHDRADAAETEYRRFLYLKKRFPDEVAAPLMDVDTFWHYHILDTLKYASDCEAVFGYFLHHYPYLGLHGEADLAARDAIGERSRQLYEQTFGDEYPQQHLADLGAAAASAYCAAPGAPADARTRTAYCAAPGRAALASATAYCAAPGAATAPAGARIVPTQH